MKMNVGKIEEIGILLTQAYQMTESMLKPGNDLAN